jgi:putative FmdB family regulatory protein
MPIYEYECRGCGQVTEKMQKMSDKPLKKCPCCGGKVDKLMSLNTFHLKGSGWYVTDYAKKKTSAPPKTEKAEKKTKEKPKDKSTKKDS